MAPALAASLLLSAVFLHWRWPALRSKRLWFSALAAAAFVMLLRTWWSVPVAAFLQALALSHPDYRRSLIWLRVPATLAIIVIALGAVPLLFQPNDLIHRSSAFALAFVVGQFLDFVAGNERAKAVSDELPRRLWIPLALICSAGWLYASAGSALRAPFAAVAVASLLYRAVDSLWRFDLPASLQMPEDGALETLEAFAILLPFCFACRWVVY